MKRIFLTSGIIACMACPAFAVGDGFVETSVDVTTSGGVTTFSANTTGTGNLGANGSYPAYSAQNVENACVQEIVGVTHGETTLRAKWTSNYCDINLDHNSAANGYADDGSDFNPITLYGINGNTTNIYTSLDANGTLTGAKVVNNALFATPLTDNLPHGATVSFVYGGDNVPSGASTASQVSHANVSTPASERPFMGAYSLGTKTSGVPDGTQFIDNEGKILSAGLTDAGSCTPGVDRTWYALYDCVTPTVTGQPTLPGYVFQGWTSQPGGGLDSTLLTACRESNRSIFPVWEPGTYDVSYECYDTVGSTAGYTGGVSGYTGTPSVSLEHPVFDSTYRFQQGTNCSAPTGYVFDGWYCIPSDTNVSASNQGGGESVTWTNDYNLRCIAKWKGERITLHWNTNNGAPSTIADGECTYTGQVALPTNPTRPGFRFNGWEVIETPVEANTPSTPAP